MSRTYRNVCVVDSNVVEIKKVDLLVEEMDEKYTVDWYYEYQIEHIDGNLYRFVPDEYLKSITISV